MKIETAEAARLRRDAWEAQWLGALREVRAEIRALKADTPAISCDLSPQENALNSGRYQGFRIALEVIERKVAALGSGSPAGPGNEPPADTATANETSPNPDSTPKSYR